MNTQLSPEEIQRYKQEMMKMYQGVGNSSGNPSPASQRVIATAPVQNTATATQNTAPAVTLPSSVTTPTQAKGAAVAGAAQAVPAANAAAVAAAAAGAARFATPDTGFIESIQNPTPEPEYIGTYYPDTGPIGVPNYPGTVSTGPAAAPSVPVPKPPVPAPVPPSDIQTPDTGYIEAPDFPAEENGTGYLRVQVHTANRAIPVPDAMLIITEETPLGRKLIHMSVTDENGYSDLIPLEVPVYPLDEFPSPENKPYRDYRLSAFADGYYIVPRIEVPIFADIKSLQSVEMVPLAENTSPLSLFPSSTSDSNTQITSVEFEQS